VGTALAYPERLALSLFTAAPEHLTPLAARIFASWTATSGILCALCAREGAIPGTPLFQATAASFAIALILFIQEMLVFGTMTPLSVSSPLVVASASLLWMAFAWHQEARPRGQHELSNAGGDANGARLVTKVSGVGGALVCTGMFWTMYQEGWPDRLDTRLIWNERDALLLLAELGLAGRASYAAMYWSLWGDMALPICYTTFFVSVFFVCFPRSKILIVLPLLAGTCDVIENLSVLALLSGYPGFLGGAAQSAITIGPLATMGKWAFLSLSGATLLVHLGRTSPRPARGKEA
jgi:hypothetical protein